MAVRSYVLWGHAEQEFNCRIVQLREIQNCSIIGLDGKPKDALYAIYELTKKYLAKLEN